MDHSNSVKETSPTCFLVSIIPKIFEKKSRKYPTLETTNVSIKQIPRYKERESPVIHIEQVSKNISEHGQLQRLVETFTGQAARWWDYHQSRLHTWTIDLTYFIEIFGGKRLTNQSQIPMFIQGQDPEEHIRTCKNEWKRLGYKDERTWPYPFPSTLSDLPKKWYKMEEARGETFQWHELKENFIKDFSFIPQNEKLVETAKQIKSFIEPIGRNNLTQNYDRPTITCNNIQTKTIT